jgi:threonine dehydratase
MSVNIEAPSLDQIRLAASRLSDLAIRTPLIRLNYLDTPSPIYLKLESMQPFGVFKIRCMGNVIKNASEEQLKHGIYTASTGSGGYATAWLANRMNLPASVLMPDSAPPGKCEAIKALGAEIKFMSYPKWWDIICGKAPAGEPGLYIDPVKDPAAIAGNGTIGLEILEDLPDVKTIVVPFGGGGVSCGIAATMQALKPDTDVIAAESEASTPVTSAFAAGKPVTVDYQASFISGIGGLSVLPEMWPMVSGLLNGSVVSSLEAVCDAIRMLFKYNRVVAEGAGATSVAGALNLESEGPIVCVVTGGNIDQADMVTILEGGIPG